MNLIRNLLGLIITITMLPVCVKAFEYASNIKFDYNEINDEIALMQLRETLLITYDMQYSEKLLAFRYKNKDFTLKLVNNKLLLQPGTQIYLNDIDDLSFINKNNCIYVIYERDNKEYERVLCNAKGLYLDDFSDCDVLDCDDNSGEE